MNLEFTRSCFAGEKRMDANSCGNVLVGTSPACL